MHIKQQQHPQSLVEYGTKNRKKCTQKYRHKMYEIIKLSKMLSCANGECTG